MSYFCSHIRKVISEMKQPAIYVVATSQIPHIYTYIYEYSNIVYTGSYFNTDINIFEYYKHCSSIELQYKLILRVLGVWTVVQLLCCI